MDAPEYIFSMWMHEYNINSQYCVPLVLFDWPDPIDLARGATMKNNMGTNH